MKSSKGIFGLIAGLAIGALIGVLVAPDKGSETRKKIFTKGDNYAQDLKNKFNDFVDEILNKTNTSEPNNESDERENTTTN